MHKLGKDTEKTNIDVVTMKLFNFSSIKLEIVIELQDSSSQNKSLIAYKVDTDSNDKVMSFYVFKNFVS